jgi:hypothetical protein
MFALVFRELLVLVGGLAIIWFVWTKVRKIGRRDAREEHVTEMMDSIDELVKLSKRVKLDPKKLKEAREKLSELEKEGNK